MLNAFFFIQLCKILTCEIPEVTLCGWRGYKPSINKQTLLQLEQALRMIGWLAIFHRRRFSVWSDPGGAECMDLTQAAGGHMLLTLWTLDSDPRLIPWYAVTTQWNWQSSVAVFRETDQLSNNGFILIQLYWKSFFYKTEGVWFLLRESIIDKQAWRWVSVGQTTLIGLLLTLYCVVLWCAVNIYNYTGMHA